MDTLNTNPLLQYLIPGFDNLSSRFQLILSIIPFSEIVFWLVIFLLAIGVFSVVLYLVHKFVLVYLQLKETYTFLEVTPPKETLKSSYTTQQLFNLLHGLARQRSWWQRFIGNQKSYAFEIVSTKDDGIRYLLRVNEEDADLIKKSLLSYLPGLSVTVAKDYLPESFDTHKRIIAQFGLANHFAFPLKKQDELGEHDPIAYITGNMTKLSKDELVVFQLVASPVNKSTIPDIKHISHLIYANKDLISGLKAIRAAGLFVGIFKAIIFLGFYILTLPIGIVVFLASSGREGPLLPLPFGNEPAKTANPYQEELEIAIKAKLDQQLFSTSIRLLVVGNNKADNYKRVRGFVSSLASFSNSAYQFIKRARELKVNYYERYKQFCFRQRLPAFFTSILSVSEVADLYHFPFTKTTRTEDIQKIHSKELPAPVSLKKANDLDVVFAKNTYGGNTTMIGLNQEERRRHMYILGATGTGKSTMLLSMINQDLQNGKGLCVIDPHGELIDSILPLIPENRIKDVVYFNPDDISYPVGLNLLELPTDITGDPLLREKELITESIISLFHKIYDDKYSGPRMEYILRNTIHTAFTTENPTLFTIYKLLINEDFRKKVTSKLEEENLHDFWKYEFSKAGDYQKVKMISPITNKIGRFLFSPTAKRILEQEKSTINFDDIMDSGKILLCNVSKGKIGEDNSQVFGTLVMTKIQLAALKRARQKSDTRRDFYLYVDEFQNFATPSFAQILSEARKYRLNAILAHQTTSQLEDKSLVHVTLANTGTVICFRTANPEDERLILPQFIPYVQQGEIDNLPSFHFYIKIAALRPEEPFSGETMPVKVPDNPAMVQRIIEASRVHFAKEFVATASTFKPKAIPNKRAFKTKTNKKSEVFPD
jgi:tetrahydromethanopterin S-methyltransferase subunit F